MASSNLLICIGNIYNRQFETYHPTAERCREVLLVGNYVLNCLEYSLNLRYKYINWEKANINITHEV